jgi:hypothetical protein
MGKAILHIDGKFMHWSSVTDAPETPLLPEPLFAQYWKDEYGRSGVVDYVNLMEMAKERGCTAHGTTVNSIIRDNRAGRGEKKLTKAQIIEAYTITDPKDFAEWSERRNKVVAAMAIQFGPEGRKQRVQAAANHDKAKGR